MNVGRVEKYTPEALSVVRIIVALLFLEHGSAKLLGFPPSPHGEPEVMTLMWIQGLIELVGGALLAFGLFARPVASCQAIWPLLTSSLMRQRVSFRCSTAVMRQSSTVLSSCFSSWPDRAGGASTPK
jgi:hypothetical protein